MWPPISRWWRWKGITPISCHRTTSNRSPRIWPSTTVGAASETFDPSECLADWAEDDVPTALLTRGVTAMEGLAVGGGLSGREINLGGLHAAPGRHQVLSYLHLTDADHDALHRLEDLGARVSARDLPMSHRVSLDGLRP